MKKITFAVAALVTSVAFASHALAEMTAGEVKKIDESAQKITLKHAPIKNLDMGEMTMVFKAGDPAILKAVKPGDKVKFEADRVNGQLTVTKIEKAK